MLRTYSRSRNALPPFTHVSEQLRTDLIVAWRPLLDLNDSTHTSNRLRGTSQILSWLDASDPPPILFTRLGIPGVRKQLVRHIGIPNLDIPSSLDTESEHLPEKWRELFTYVQHFAELDWRRRAHLVVALAQLSFHQAALSLADSPSTHGEPTTEYLLAKARVSSSIPARRAVAITVFDRIASSNSVDAGLRSIAIFQGIGHALLADDTERAFAFDLMARDVHPEPSWEGTLISSRLCRARSLLQLRMGDLSQAWDLLHQAEAFNDSLAIELGPTEPEVTKLIKSENTRYLTELRLRLLLVEPKLRRDLIISACTLLEEADPFCIHTHVTLGDTWHSLGEVVKAADSYLRAGDLRTATGAVSLFRAAQCFEALDDELSAKSTYERVLELDPEALEPRQWLEKHHHAHIIHKPPRNLEQRFLEFEDKKRP